MRRFRSDEIAFHLLMSSLGVGTMFHYRNTAGSPLETSQHEVDMAVRAHVSLDRQHYHCWMRSLNEKMSSLFLRKMSLTRRIQMDTPVTLCVTSTLLVVHLKLVVRSCLSLIVRRSHSAAVEYVCIHSYKHLQLKHMAGSDALDDGHVHLMGCHDKMPPEDLMSGSIQLTSPLDNTPDNCSLH